MYEIRASATCWNEGSSGLPETEEFVICCLCLIGRLLGLRLGRPDFFLGPVLFVSSPVFDPERDAI